MGVLALTIGLCGSVDLPRSQGKPLIFRAGPSPLQSKDSHLTFLCWFWQMAWISSQVMPVLPSSPLIPFSDPVPHAVPCLRLYQGPFLQDVDETLLLS